MNFGSGLKVTVPSGATVYVPSPSTVNESTLSPVLGSTNLAGTVSSISTVFSSPLTIAVPPWNSGLPVWVAPWTSTVLAGSASGCAGMIDGV